MRSEAVYDCKTARESTKLLRRTERHASGGRCFYLEDGINTLMVGPRPVDVARDAARRVHSLTAKNGPELFFGREHRAYCPTGSSNL